ncbi:MAG: hypothetical protein V4510_08235 [bacterium]
MFETSETWPGSTNPGGPPANWSGTSGPGSELGVALFDCARVQWGPYERPLQFILELHTNMTTPAACRRGQFDNFYILNAIYVDDANVTRFLRDELGFPALNTAINVTFQGDKMAASWRPEGGEVSEVQDQRLHAYDSPESIIRRVAWETHGHVSLLDWTAASQTAQPGVVPATGHMRPPMLQSKMGDPYIGGRGGFDGFTDDTEVEGHLYRFNDDQCKAPIDPYP